MAGRPCELTLDRQERVIQALRLGNTRKASATAGSVTFPTFLAQIKRDPEFAAAVQAAEDEAERSALQTIRDAMPDTWQAAAWWLERRRPQQYGKQERLTLLRDLAKDAEKLSDEELALLAYGDGDEDEPGSA